MEKVTLTEYAEDKSQAMVARELGVSRAAVSQMLDSGREIYVETDQAGSVIAWEKRQIPARRVTVG